MTDDAKLSALSQLCQRLGVSAQVNPGLDPNGPSVVDDGDDRYALGDEIGRGGQATVRLAVDRNLRRTVALKLLPRRDLDNKNKVQRFVEEAVITGGLEHPNIVPAYDVDYSEQLGLHYSMKRLPGRSLYDIIGFIKVFPEQAQRQFNLFRLLTFFADICRGIAYAHSRGVIHSDLKPANIVVGALGEVWIVDWGLAQVMGPAGTGQARARARAGTPHYMAPEQAYLTGGQLDALTDVWSLGVILYELLTLERPFEGEDDHDTVQRVVEADLVPPSRCAPDRPIPPDVESICVRALTRDRDERYASVKLMLDDIQAYLDGTRERTRRQEIAQRCLDDARMCLLDVSRHENKLDILLSDSGCSADTVDTARVELMNRYGAAIERVLEGLDADAGLPAIERLAGDLYWAVFARVYPSRRAPSDALRERALECLSELSRKALGAVIRTGKAQADLSPGDEQDPWLSAVVSFCQQHETTSDSPLPSEMTRLVSRIQAFKNVDLFAKMPAPELMPIAEAATEMHAEAGEIIFEEGDEGDALYVVLSGRVDIERDGALLNSLGPGEVFGEIAVLHAESRTATVRAIEPTRCLTLEAGAFNRIVRENGEIGWSVVQVLTERIRFATEREAQVRASMTF